MLYRALFLGLSSLAAIVSAQDPSATPAVTNYNDYQNPFSIPSSGLAFTAGQATTIHWSPTTSGTITLVLRSGSSNDLNDGTVIVSHHANSGSYTWTPPSSITRGSDYTLEIISDSNPSQVNFSPYFVIDSTNTVPSSTSAVTYGAVSTQRSLTSVGSTGFASSTASRASSATHSASGSKTSSGSSASATSGTAASVPTGGAGVKQVAGGFAAVVAAMGAVIVL